MKLFSQKNKKQKGFTILFAVLVSSLVLALGLGIISITMKEVQLSGAGRDSQLAFYAADSGAECAFYWDLKGNYFATSSSWTEDSAYPQNSMKCNKQVLVSNYDWINGKDRGDTNSATTTFWFTMDSVPDSTSFNHTNPSDLYIQRPCTTVTISKFMDGTNQKTSIDARGYNTCDASNKRRLERGYSIEY